MKNMVNHHMMLVLLVKSAKSFVLTSLKNQQNHKHIYLMYLLHIFQEVMKRREDLRDPIHAGFGKIEKQQIDTKEAILFVERYIMNRRRCTFRSLLMLREGRMYTVVTFLTILELMKLGRIYVTQNDNFGEINIEANDPSQWNDDGMDFMSEWSEDSDLPEREEKPDGTAEI